MKTNHFLKQLHDDDIVAAIRDAEKKTSGEIRVFISHRKIKNTVEAATEQFHRLGMTKTKHRNAVLIYVAPAAQQFAVIGDEGVHRQCGDAFWQLLTQEMSSHFKKSEFTPGILHAVRKAGELLAVHFPPEPENNDELPDGVARD
ncbi:MAG TPA: TPM domain-containing protein [Verrucomicrobiae bacterium]|nr:TPM domain-containing protein [Verrucomicrobiae bacterium]